MYAILSCRHAHNSPINEWVPRKDKQKTICSLCPFFPNPDKQRNVMIFVPNNLGRTCSSHKAGLWKLLFSRQLLHYTVGRAALGMIALRLLLLIEMWCSCTTTKYAGTKEWTPVLFVSWRTLSPIMEKLAASSCAELCAQPGKGQACQGVCCLSTENGTLWSVAGVDLWLLSAASPYYRP